MNELEDSDSAYLQHHAENPIHWKKWSKKNINESLKKNQKTKNKTARRGMKSGK